MKITSAAKKADVPRIYPSRTRKMLRAECTPIKLKPQVRLCVYIRSVRFKINLDSYNFRLKRNYHISYIGCSEKKSKFLSRNHRYLIIFKLELFFLLIPLDRASKIKASLYELPYSQLR